MVSRTAKIRIGMDVIGLMKLEPSPFALETNPPDRIRIDIAGYSEILDAPVPQVVIGYASTDPNGMATDIGRFRYLAKCTAARQERNNDKAHRKYRASSAQAAPRLIQTIEVIHISPAA
jgi:hypothetical protein